MKLRVLGYLVLLIMATVSVFGQEISAQHASSEEPCFWDDGICFDYQTEGGSGGGYMGIAPGITTCTTNIGCKSCVVVDGQGSQFVCATVPESNGSCKCEMTPGCTATGSCTYRG